MTAAMYVVGGPRYSDDRSDLRYSLRSLAANAPVIDDVWIVGDVPGWIRDAHTIPLDPLPGKFENQRQSIEAFLHHPDAPKQFYLLNDDHFVIERVDGPLPAYHIGKTSEFVASLPPRKRLKNTWVKAVMATAGWMEDMGYGDVLCYEAHTPLLFDRRKLGDLLSAYPRDVRLAVGEMYAAAGAGGEGRDVGNAKVRKDDRLADKLAQDMPYLSASPVSWVQDLGDYVRALFPEPCRWEA